MIGGTAGIGDGAGRGTSCPPISGVAKLQPVMVFHWPFLADWAYILPMTANDESQKTKRAFAKRLAAIRVSLGFTQEEFSRLIGIARDRYAKYELGRSEPPFFILNRIVKFTGHSLDFLIAGNKPGKGHRTAGTSPADLADDLRGNYPTETGWWWRTDEIHRVVDTWRPSRNPAGHGPKTGKPARVVGPDPVAACRRRPGRLRPLARPYR